MAYFSRFLYFRCYFTRLKARKNKEQKYKKLEKYLPYCTRHCAITSTYIKITIWKINSPSSFLKTSFVNDRNFKLLFFVNKTKKKFLMFDFVSFFKRKLYLRNLMQVKKLFCLFLIFAFVNVLKCSVCTIDLGLYVSLYININSQYPYSNACLLHNY